MIEDHTCETLLRSLGAVTAQWTDAVAPASVELLDNHRYSPRYAWMYSYEKRLKYRIEEVLDRPLGELEKDLFGADGVLSEALSNAFVHGHRRDQHKVIEVTCHVGEHGLLFSIRDQGEGFDAGRAMSLLKRGGTYFHMAGNGLRALAEKPGVVASYESRGTVLHIMVAFDQPGDR